MNYTLNLNGVKFKVFIHLFHEYMNFFYISVHTALNPRFVVSSSVWNLTVIVLP